MFRRIAQTLLSTLLICVCGCALFSGASVYTDASGYPLQERKKPKLDGVPVRQVIHLDTSITSAAESDRRLRIVWEELDESGPMSPQDRRRLNETGMRVGVAGSALPWALKSLQRGERGGMASDSTASDQMSFGNSVAVVEGDQTTIELPGSGHLMIPPGELPGFNSGRDLKNAKCVLQITPVEHGPGWVVIRVLPKIQHGSTSVRYNMTDQGEQMPTRQNETALYEQQFELKVHENETVVIGHLKSDEWTLGRLQFQSESLTSVSERLIAFRLNKITQVVGQKSLQVSYREY